MKHIIFGIVMTLATLVSTTVHSDIMKKPSKDTVINNTLTAAQLASVRAGDTLRVAVPVTGTTAETSPVWKYVISIVAGFVFTMITKYCHARWPNFFP